MGISWSAMRHQLENDYLCDPLKGRIRYFVTSYRTTRNNVVTVFLDDHVVFHSSLEHWGQNREAILHQIYNPKKYDQPAITDANNYELAVLERGGFDKDHFFEAFHIFQNQSIQKSLASENPIVRMLAVLDRRVGKRQLPTLEEAIDRQPEWLQFFYRLRIEAESKGPDN